MTYGIACESIGPLPSSFSDNCFDGILLPLHVGYRGGNQVWWILFLLLLTTSASTFLKNSCIPGNHFLAHPCVARARALTSPRISPILDAFYSTWLERVGGNVQNGETEHAGPWQNILSCRAWTNVIVANKTSPRVHNFRSMKH